MGDEAGTQRPESAAGALNQRSYRVRILEPRLNAVAVMDLFRRDPIDSARPRTPRSSPTPRRPVLQMATPVEIKLPGPWNGPVRVTRLTPTSMRFETLQGHREAGHIEFEAHDLPDGIDFSIHSLARSGDRPFDVLYSRLRVAKQMQSQMWAQVLEAAVQESGGRQQGRLLFDTVVFTGRRP